MVTVELDLQMVKNFISNKCANILVNEFHNNKISESIDWWKNKMIEKYELEVYWAEPTLMKTNLVYNFNSLR